jgi:amino acid transporter
MRESHDDVSGRGERGAGGEAGGDEKHHWQRMSTKRAKLGMWSIVALVFFNVSGGGFGSEEIIEGAGPLVGIAGCVLGILFYSVPMALMTAELSSAFPEDGGYTVWISEAFGPFWGFQLGWVNWFSGVVDNSVYPSMMVKYLMYVIPAAFHHGVYMWALKMSLVCGLTVLNLCGLEMVGHVAIGVLVLVAVPFAWLSLAMLPRVNPANWLRTKRTGVNWTKFINFIAWNYGSLDDVSTISGELEDPAALHSSMMMSVLVIFCATVVPIALGVGAASAQQVEGDPEWLAWKSGYFSALAESYGGAPLMYTMGFAAMWSCAAQFVAELTTDSYQVWGQAQRGHLPKFVSRKSVNGAPYIAILFSFVGMVFLVSLPLDSIVEITNGINSMALTLEASALVWLRVKSPDLVRPYRVPIDNVWLLGLVMLPVSLLPLATLYFSSPIAKLVTLASFACGVCGYFFIEHLRDRQLVEFLPLTVVLMEEHRDPGGVNGRPGRGRSYSYVVEPAHNIDPGKRVSNIQHIEERYPLLSPTKDA